MKIISNLPNPGIAVTGRPDGELKDVSSPGAGDGTPAREDWLNDLYYAFLSKMNDVGISADDSDEAVETATTGSQFLTASRLFSAQYAYPGIDQGLKDISAGNQSTSLTSFESGGGSEKVNGYTVKIRWTGGDASFTHTITSAYTIGNETIGYIASNLWIGHGDGELILRLDKTNSRWTVLNNGSWDKIIEATDAFTTYKYTSRKMEKFLTNKSISATNTLLTFDISFLNTSYVSSFYFTTAGGAAIRAASVITKLAASIDMTSVIISSGASSAGDYDISFMGQW
jgi:hypothetical protein